MDLLLSIKPEYANKILAGTKIYEFRKTNICKPINKVYLYSTAPVKKVVGYVELEQIIKGTPKNVWDRCSEYCGIAEKDYFKYYQNKEVALALQIKKVVKFTTPKLFIELDQSNKVPQSFKYIN